jgi:hypothetical protein
MCDVGHKKAGWREKATRTDDFVRIVRSVSPETKEFCQRSPLMRVDDPAEPIATDAQRDCEYVASLNAF